MKILLSRRQCFAVGLGWVPTTILSMQGSMAHGAMASSSSSPDTTCAVVGVGVLGTSLCRQLLSDSSLDGMTVTGFTKSTNRHDQIRHDVLGESSDGSSLPRFHLKTLALDSEATTERFGNVIFCAPPSGFEDYPGAIQRATQTLWLGPEAGGVFIFTSSGAVYGTGDTGIVTESTPPVAAEANPRISRLVRAEQAALDAGGCCLRLAGLYNLQRGAHNFWLTSGKEIDTSPEGIINLLHYDDAAGACVAAVKAGLAVCQKSIFLISDGNPMTRREICASARKAVVYQNFPMPTFIGKESVALGKIYDGSASNEALRWKPEFAKSFDAFMSAHA